MRIFSILFLVIFNFAFVSSGLAVTFKSKTSGSENKRKAANESIDAENALLSQIASCVSKIKTSEDISQCSKEYISSKRTEDQKKALLVWFSLPLEVPTPEKCKAEDLEFVPEKIMSGSKIALCSGYNLNGLDKKVIFLISEENGKLKLFNLKD